MWGKAWALIAMMLVLIPAVHAFTACDVNFEPPWFAIPSSNGYDYLFVVDSKGDVFLGAQSASTGVSTIDSLSNALLVYSLTLAKLVFALNANYLQVAGNIVSKATSIPEVNAWVFKYGNTPIAAITSSGDVYAKGYAVYAGSDANCPPNERYCDTSSGDIYEKDYYCGSSNWTCTYTTRLYQDCNDNAYDSDGSDIDTNGTCVDYDLCSTGDTVCPYIVYQDKCTGNPVNVSYATYYDTVREYVVDSAGTSCVYTDTNVYSCKYNVDPKTNEGSAEVTVCSNGKRTILSAGCCQDSDCPNNPYAICDNGEWVCFNHECQCISNPDVQ